MEKEMSTARFRYSWRKYRQRHRLNEDEWSTITDKALINQVIIVDILDNSTIGNTTTNRNKWTIQWANTGTYLVQQSRPEAQSNQRCSQLAELLQPLSRQPRTYTFFNSTTKSIINSINQWISQFSTVKCIQLFSRFMSPLHLSLYSVNISSICVPPSIRSSDIRILFLLQQFLRVACPCKTGHQ